MILAQIGIAVDQRFNRFLNLIFDESSHVKDLFAKFGQLFFVFFVGMFVVTSAISLIRNGR